VEVAEAVVLVPAPPVRLAAGVEETTLMVVAAVLVVLVDIKLAMVVAAAELYRFGGEGHLVLAELLL
jgi:hypothetical protein